MEKLLKEYLEDIDYLINGGTVFYFHSGYLTFAERELNLIVPEYKDTKAADYYFLKGWNWNRKGKIVSVKKHKERKERIVISDDVWQKLRNEKSK